MAWELLLQYPAAIAFLQANGSDLTRYQGPYQLYYFSMLISSTLLPIVLIFKNVGSKVLAIFLVAIFMNHGWIIELSMMLLINNEFDLLNSMFKGQIQWIVIGILAASCSIVIESFISKKQN